MPDRTGTLLVGGSLAVQLIDAPAAFADQVERELGGVPGDARDLPLLSVRFVSRIERRPSLTLLGVTGGAFAYDDRSFYLVQDGGGLVALDLEGDAGRVEVVAERGVERIPLLASLAGLLLLEEGLVLLHASSFAHDGRGVLVAGWQSGGKSELMLGFMAGGQARYAGDEWTIVGFGDGTMRGLPSHPHLWAWQLEQLPTFAARVPPADRRRLGLLSVGRGAIGRLPRGARAGVVARVLRSFEGWLANASRVSVPAARLFGDLVEPGPIAVDHVLLPSVTADGSMDVSPVPGSEVAERMVASLAYERRQLEAAHAQLRYAFPARRWRRLDDAPAKERAILVAALGSVPAHAVRHPYPPDLAALADAAAAVVSAGR